MSAPNRVPAGAGGELRLLDRMSKASQDNVDTLITAVQRVSRELSSLSFNYNGHMIRAGMRSAELEALDALLEEVSTSLSRTLFDLQQRLLGDVQALRGLMRVFETVDLEDERPVEARLREGIDDYVKGLEQEHHQIIETLGALTLRLRLLANNVEIAACQAGGEDRGPAAAGGAPVGLFVAMAGLLRGLADRLRGATADLRIFEQTQNGLAESLRMALSIGEKGDAA